MVGLSTKVCWHYPDRGFLTLGRGSYVELGAYFSAPSLEGRETWMGFPALDATHVTVEPIDGGGVLSTNVSSFQHAW